VQLAALEDAHPGTTLTQLVNAGLLQARTVEAAVSETSTDFRTATVDPLGLTRDSVDTTTYSDGTSVTQHLYGLTYDREGQLLGSTTDVRNFGPTTQIDYQLDGEEAGPSALNALLAQNGVTLWSLFSSGRLQAVTVSAYLDKTTTTARTGIAYNGFGQMTNYTDSSSDPQNDVQSQVSAVSTVYNKLGLTASQITAGTSISNEGNENDSSTTMVYQYSPSGLLLGAYSQGNFTSQETSVLTDNPDGTVSEVDVPPTTGTTQQFYSVFEGQVQLLYGLTDTLSTAADGTQTTGQSAGRA
jgi:hypothetical protein